MRARRQKTVSAAGALAIVLGGGTMLATGLGVAPIMAAGEAALQAVLPTRNSPAPAPSPSPAPSPTPVPAPQQQAQATARQPEGKRANAAQIVAPQTTAPLVLDPPPLTTAPVTGTGSAARAGLGTTGNGPGAGGFGGEGNGGNGAGAGSGNGNAATYPEQVSGRLRYSEIPRELRRERDGTIRLRYRIGRNGRVSDCRILRSSGLPDFDAATCQRITDRFRFRPARNASGDPVPFTMTETHGWDDAPGAL